MNLLEKLEKSWRRPSEAGSSQRDSEESGGTLYNMFLASDGCKNRGRTLEMLEVSQSLPYHRH